MHINRVCYEMLQSIMNTAKNAFIFFQVPVIILINKWCSTELDDNHDAVFTAWQPRLAAYHLTSQLKDINSKAKSTSLNYILLLIISLHQPPSKSLPKCLSKKKFQPNSKEICFSIVCNELHFIIIYIYMLSNYVIWFC